MAPLFASLLSRFLSPAARMTFNSLLHPQECTTLVTSSSFTGSKATIGTCARDRRARSPHRVY